MGRSFWLKGFYFERRVFFFNTVTLDTLRTFRGLSHLFINLFIVRLPLLEAANDFGTPSTITLRTYKKLKYIPSTFGRLDSRILLVRLILTSFPVFLEMNSQHRSNLWRHFLIRSKRGIFLKISRPLGRRTRSRTYLKRNQTKRLVSEKPSRVRRATSRWF